MSKNTSRLSRRRLLGLSLVGVGALATAPARAALPQLDAADPLAVALNYVHDAAEAARVSPTDTCATCLQYTGDPTAEWGPCNLFQAKAVSAKGWCTGFVPKS